MKLRWLAAAVAVCALVLFGPDFSAAASPSAYKIGDHVANFTFKDDQGKTVSLNQFKGKIVVLNFFAVW